MEMRTRDALNTPRVRDVVYACNYEHVPLQYERSGVLQLTRR